MRHLVSALLALGLALAVAGTAAADGNRSALLAGVDFIRTTQRADGGFGPLGQSMDAVFAIRAAGIDPNTVALGGKSPADYLRAEAAAAAARPGNAAKAALGARALGLDPRTVSGVDLVAAIQSAYDPGSGHYAADAFTQSIAMLGLACTGNEIPARAILALAAGQLRDGGWGFDGVSDADTTAIAVQALIAAGISASDARVQNGIGYLSSTQLDDGGWGFGSESNASSTAYAIQGLLAAGIDPSGGPYARPGGNPMTFLGNQQAPDGSFAGFDPAFATNQALPALAGRTFCSAPRTPIGSLPPAAEPRPGPSPVAPLPPRAGTGAASGGASGGGAATALALAAIAFATAGFLRARGG